MSVFPSKRDSKEQSGLFEKLFPKSYMEQTHKIASKKVILGLSIAVPILLLLVGNFTIALITESFSAVFNQRLPSVSLLMAFRFPANVTYYLIILVISAVFEITGPRKLWNSYRDFNQHLKGTERWATISELREQYVSVPEKDEPFEGTGGVPIAWDRERGRILIDRSSVNNYIIGTTRSGKGETFMFPTIDIYSRAEKKSSLIITDPKLELYKCSKKTLEERGYTCLLLNLAEAWRSMKFNPLQTIIDAWRVHDYASAEELCMSFAYSMFNNDSKNSSGDQEFWNSTGSNLLCAMILAHVSDCLSMDERRNAKREMMYRRRRKLFDGYSEEVKMGIRNMHANMTLEDVLDEGNTPIEPEYKWVPSRKYEKQVTMYSIYVTFSRLASTQVGNKTALDLYFETRGVQDRARLKYTAANVSGDKTKASIYATMIAKLQVFSYTNIAKMTSASDIDLLDVGFGDKPYAIFLSMPDYDSSNYFIASIFIRQLYFILAKHCTTNTSDGKCTREVVFLLDEFGNIPSIDGMSSLITVCLGRNIKFNLIVQSNAQIKDKYGEGTETIMGNCGNWYFLASGHKETRVAFSEELGYETVLQVSRSGSEMSLNKSLSESYDNHYLMDQNALAGLHEGENVVCRRMTRRNLKGEDIKIAPIKNVENQRFKYRFQYLTNSFPNLNDIDINSIEWPDTTDVNLEDHVYDTDIYFRELCKQLKGKGANQS